jgi:thiamine biosynthesis lipoprotein
MAVRIAVPPILPAALAGHDPAAPIVDLSGETMGTSWRVRFARPAGMDIAALEIAIFARLAAIVAEMSHWEPGSLLSRFNRAAPGTWIRLPPDFAAVIAAGLAVAARSDGAFDPAIGRLVDLWGFGPPGAAAPPDALGVAAAQAASGWRRLAFDAAGGWLRQPDGVALDLSGIAKGFAVDAVVDLLGMAGARHCLVEIGGELSGRGLRPDGDPWWVDIETPPGASLPPLRIALHGIAIATSGDYVRGAHTIDPRTGRPADDGLMAVSVLHGSAMIADAWASALIVAGAEALALATRERLAARFVVREASGMCERMSPALAAMIAAEG